jgi:glycosyltransferase involved in cell wall biosynthesis
MAEQARRLVPELKDIAITPFGVDLFDYRNLTPEFSGQKSEMVIGTVKSMKYIYGIDNLIKSYDILIKRLEISGCSKKLKLRIVGEGTELSRLQDLTEKLGVSESVDFIGRVPHSEVPNELAKLDVYVALSRSESFGVAVLEASAAGCPVVVSNVGGLPEVTINGETGFIVPVDDPEAAAEVLMQLVLDADLRFRMGAAGQRLVEAHYSWDQCVQTMIGVYQSAISNYMAEGRKNLN